MQLTDLLAYSVVRLVEYSCAKNSSTIGLEILSRDGGDLNLHLLASSMNQRIQMFVAVHYVELRNSCY